VNLFDDENKQSLGRMPLVEANKLAKFRELILVLFDESHDPPDVRLMTGKQLAQIRDETRANKKQELANEKITDFSLRLRPHIADNDLLTKISQAKAAYSKGCSIRFSLDFGRAIDEKETDQLVSEHPIQSEVSRSQKNLGEGRGRLHSFIQLFFSLGGTCE
jgi:translation initiation factor IF-3